VGRLGTDIFQPLKAVPILGRTFGPDDFREGALPVAIVSAALFEEAFGASPSAIGATVNLEGKPYTVVGVAPRTLAVFGDMAIWAPIEDPGETWSNRQYHLFIGVGRLRRGIALAQARGQLDMLASRLAVAYPATNTNWTFEIARLDEMILGDRVRPILLMLMAAACAVLALGCINIANLLVARATKRHREIALRLALGCSRARLVRELLIEGAVLAAAALGVAVVCAREALPVLARVPLSTTLAFQPALRLDAGFAAAVLAAFIVTTLLAALAPAWRASATDPRSGFHARTCRASNDRAHTAGLLTSAEIAIAIVLAAGALVLLRSANRLDQAPLGIQPERVLMTTIGLDEVAYPTYPSRAAYFARIEGDVQALPGVAAVALTNYAPITDPGFNLRMTIEGRPAVESGDVTSAPLATVSPGFFDTLRIPLRRGRLFDAHDGAAAPLVLVVNEAFARKFLSGIDAIGRRIRLGENVDGWRTIVGIVGDVRSSRLDQGPEPTMYAPLVQEPRASTLLIRVHGDTATADAIRRAVIRVDPTQAIAPVRPFQQVVSGGASAWHFRATVLALLAAMALVLTAVGVYAVASFAVEQRTAEWGIRLAIGAAPSALVAGILRRQARVVLAGATAGVVGAVATAGALRQYVFGVSAIDPLSLGVATCVAASIAALATFIPARRAARVDPMIALRAE
jgi:putative ABC transport system permease protein